MNIWAGVGMAAFLVWQANGGDGAGGGISFAPRTPAEDACGAAALRHLVGQPVAAAEALGLPQPLRIHAVDQPVTMDHLPERLNIVTDRPGGTIVAIRCG